MNRFLNIYPVILITAVSLIAGISLVIKKRYLIGILGILAGIIGLGLIFLIIDIGYF